MSLVIELPRAIEVRLEDEARDAGVTVSEIVFRVISDKFPFDLDEKARSLSLIEKWLAEAPSNPEQIKEAEEDLLEFQRAINQSRLDSGARLIYAGVELA